MPGAAASLIWTSLDDEIGVERQPPAGQDQGDLADGKGSSKKVPASDEGDDRPASNNGCEYLQRPAPP